MTIIHPLHATDEYPLDVVLTTRGQVGITFLRSIGYGDGQNTAAYLVEIRPLELRLVQEAVQAHPDERFTLMLPISEWSQSYLKFAYSPPRQSFGVAYEARIELTYVRHQAGEIRTSLKADEWHNVLDATLGE